MKQLIEKVQVIDPETGRASTGSITRHVLEKEDISELLKELSAEELVRNDACNWDEKFEYLITALRGIAETQAVMMVEIAKLKEAITKGDTVTPSPTADESLRIQLIKLPHVGNATAKRMINGYKNLPKVTSVKDLAGMDWQQVTIYPGVTDKEARQILKEAAKL